jgi:DnaJ-class molecular chaperone
MTSPKDVPDELFEQFGDLFGELFKQGKASAPDLGVSLQLTLADVYGVEREIDVPRFIGCVDCGGRGAPGDSLATSCSACDGDGHLTQTQGVFHMRTVCDVCRGRGERFDFECHACAGVGGTTRPEKLMVTVPPGVADGQVLRLQGEGNQMAERIGDLFITLVIAPHEQLVRTGDDLLARVEISAQLARSGGTAKVPLPKGEVDVKVPAFAETGTEIRLGGYGTPRLDSSPPVSAPSDQPAPHRSAESSIHRGDLVVRFTIEGEEDPLGVLGLSKGASIDDIKQAYRQQAMAYHPDRHPGDANAAHHFQEADAAFTALSGEPRSTKLSNFLWWAAVAVGAVVFYYVALR